MHWCLRKISWSNLGQAIMPALGQALLVIITALGQALLVIITALGRALLVIMLALGMYNLSRCTSELIWLLQHGGNFQ